MTYETKAVHSILWKQKWSHTLATPILFHAWHTLSPQIFTFGNFFHFTVNQVQIMVVDFMRNSVEQVPFPEPMQPTTEQQWREFLLASSFCDPLCFWWSHLWTVSIKLIFCPFESICVRIRISSWADSKPFGTKGNFRSWHYSGYSWSVLSCGRRLCLEYVRRMRRAGWFGRGERGYHAQVSCPVVHIFSVKQHVFRHIWACAFSLITRPEKLFWQMWPWMCVYVCVCVKHCHEVIWEVLWVCYSGSSPIHTHLTSQEK